jgi:hypothetical protein
MTFKLTAEKKTELKKMAKESGVSYESLVEAEKTAAIYREGGIEALIAAGYDIKG